MPYIIYQKGSKTITFDCNALINLPLQEEISNADFFCLLKKNNFECAGT